MADPYAEFSSPVEDDPYASFSSPVSKPKARANDKTGNPVIDYMARSNNKKIDRLDQATANREARKDNPSPVFQPVKDFLAPGIAAVNAFKQDYASHAGGRQLPKSPGEFVSRMGEGFGDTQRQGQNALATVFAPAVGVTNQVVNPLARLGERAGIMDEEFNANALNTAAAGTKGGATPRVRSPNALAPVVEQFDRAGVRPGLATAGGGKGKASVANVVAENPVAGGRTRANLRGAMDDASQSANTLAGQYGTTRGPQITGENVQGGVKRFASDKTAPTFAAKAGQLYDDAFAKINANGGPVTAAQTEATLNIIANRAGGEIGALITDPKINAIAKALAADKGSIGFQDLRELRTWVRTAQKDPQLRQGIDQASLGSLERALTADIMSGAETLAGPKAAHDLRRADQYYAAGQARIQTALQPFADAQSGESAYRRIVQAAQSGAGADAQRVLSLKRSLKPDEWGDISSNMISDLGKPTAGQAGMGEDFSVSTFLTNYEKLSPRARDVLFGSVGGGGQKATGLKSDLDNLASVIGRLKAVEKGANVSKSAVSIQGQGTIGGGAVALGSAMMGNFAPLGAYVAALTGFAGAGEIMTNPAFVRWLAGSARTPPARSMSRLEALAATSPAISAYRQRLLEQSQGNGQPVGGNVNVPELQSEPAPAGL